MKRLLLLAFTLLSLTACSTLPPELNAHNTEEPITDFYQWKEIPASQQKDVRLGGSIISITNLANKTRLEIANIPINKAGRPNIDYPAQGRYVVYFDSFLDPVAYPVGSLITVVGKTAPSEKGKIGDYEYTFPVIEGYGRRTWFVEESTYIIRDDYYWRHGCDYRRGRGCRGYYHPNQPVRVEVIKQVR